MAVDVRVTPEAAVEVVKELSEDEAKDRHHLELKVERAFVEAGKALSELRDRRLYLTFPVKSERDANLHKGLAISTNHAKAPGYQSESYGDAPSNHPSELQLPVPKQRSRLWAV